MNNNLVNLHKHILWGVVVVIIALLGFGGHTCVSCKKVRHDTFRECVKLIGDSTVCHFGPKTE